MGPLTSSDVTGAALIGLGALVLLVLLVLTAVVVVIRSGRARRAQQAAELDRSRAEVESLTRRVEELSQDVDRNRRAALEDREYVITSLAEAERGELRDRRTGAGRVVLSPNGPVPDRRPLGELVEDHLVAGLARNQDGSAFRSRAVDLVVRTVALGHGVRQALSPDNLDRAAAEAHVARRRSRRVRKRELREARRLLRVVRTHQRDEDVA
jgi:hypothetical protein